SVEATVVFSGGRARVPAARGIPEVARMPPFRSLSPPGRPISRAVSVAARKFHARFHAQSNVRRSKSPPARQPPGVNCFEERGMNNSQAAVTRTVDNGVNVEALLGAREALTEAPEAAR